MAETYAVEASLEWKTNVPAVLREVMAAFEQVNRTVAQFKDKLAELSGSGKGVSALIRQLNRLKVPPEALDGLREMGNVTRTLEEAQAGLAKEARETAQAWRQMAEASKQVRLPSGGGAGGRQGGKGGGGHGWSHGDLVDGAMGAQMAGDAGMGLAGQAFHAYADVQLQTTLAQADKRVTDAVMARANGVITTLQKQYPALTQTEGLTLFRNTMGIFGDADESLAALPGAVRLQQLYELAPLGKGGTGGSEVQAAEKAGDAMQSFIDPKTGKLDKGLYDKWMDLQARSYTAGGGLVDAKNWLAFARTSRSAGIGLSDRALEETQALLEMSPGRTGTALMSAFQVFGASTKHMTKANRGAWNKAGLLDKSGDIVDQQLYQKDPYAWVWDEMVPKLAARGIKTREQVLKWLTENGQRGTVSGLLADIAVGKTPITNTATKMENQDPKLVDKLVNTDVGKLAAFHAAETNFLVALGKFGEGPGLTLLTDLTKILNKLVEEAEAHPEAAKRLIGVGAGLVRAVESGRRLRDGGVVHRRAAGKGGRRAGEGADEVCSWERGGGRAGRTGGHRCRLSVCPLWRDCSAWGRRWLRVSAHVAGDTVRHARQAKRLFWPSVAHRHVRRIHRCCWKFPGHAGARFLKPENACARARSALSGTTRSCNAAAATRDRSRADGAIRQRPSPDGQHHQLHHGGRQGGGQGRDAAAGGRSEKRSWSDRRRRPRRADTRRSYGAIGE